MSTCWPFPLKNNVRTPESRELLEKYSIQYVPVKNSQRLTKEDLNDFEEATW